jgi:hypothetical protein
VRFPAEGIQADAKFSFEATAPVLDTKPLSQSTLQTKLKRSDVINAFLKQAYSELHSQGILVSLDVFGIMAWQRSVDLAHTGQDIASMAQYCDVLSPMIYPSHFYGMDGYALPGDAPEHFISSSMERFRKITGDSGPALRPWLQAFAWKTKTYSPQYIKTQVLVSKNYGGIGFLLWNARNDYAKPLAAMAEMTPASEVYFGKSKLPIPDKSEAATKIVARRSKSATGAGKSSAPSNP